MEPQPQLTQWFELQLMQLGIIEEPKPYLVFCLLFALASVLAFLIDLLSNKLLLKIISRVSGKTKTQVDDILVRNNVFLHLSHLLPVYFFEFIIPHLFYEFPGWIPVAFRIAHIVLVLLLVRLANVIIKSLGEILGQTRFFRNKPIDSYTQLSNLVVYLVAGIMLFSVVFDKSPIYLFSALGAMTAVLLLIFKDTILGFVASIQLASNDMIRVGDWVTMEKYGADGDVIEINLTTIKIRNWDKTISTIPTYYFIADSFKNWRGMSESGGRRIKRAVYIDVRTVCFATPELLKELQSVELIQDYLSEKQMEVDAYNTELAANKSELINGRQLTNLGIFRIYLERYLEKNSQLNLQMTYMVRQLPSGPTGIPLEVYAFSANQDWLPFEQINADIFDHIFAAVERFGLEIFQNPSGSDLESISKGLAGKETPPSQ